jgi:3-dehydroquinate dehydratase type II
MKKIYIINGPNLNMLGVREPEIYGSESYSTLVKLIKSHAKTLGFRAVIFQSNHEGALIDKIQEAYFHGADGIVINPAGYTHTSIALLDAIKSVKIPTVEVHISEPSCREIYRHTSYVREAVIKTVSGRGLMGYIEAIDYILNYAS